MNTTQISTSTVDSITATEAELVLLGQVIDLDGREQVVLGEDPVTNGSGRVVGTHLTVTDEAWAFVQESISA